MIWQNCNGEKHVTPIQGRVYRLVESQQQIATLNYVDTLEEQALLEQLLEQSKPDHRVADCQDYHYLLKTPFRYSPLKWGSRFSRIHESGIFYGALSVATTLAESAYYRWLFWFSIEAAPITPMIRSEHTLFWLNYQTSQGIQLQHPPFDQFVTDIANPTYYQAAQQLGSQMREANIAAFEYPSARDKEKGQCIALLTPTAFCQKHPESMQQWLCEVSGNRVLFKQAGPSCKVYCYPIADFLVAGKFPMPA